MLFLISSTTHLSPRNNHGSVPIGVGWVCRSNKAETANSIDAKRGGCALCFYLIRVSIAMEEFGVHALGLTFTIYNRCRYIT